MLAGSLLITIGLAWWVMQVTLLRPDERNNASGYGQFVLAALGLLIMLCWLHEEGVCGCNATIARRAD